MTESPLDPYKDIFGLDLSPERLDETLQAYAEILRAIQKLRVLDLTELHPAVVFDPTDGYSKDSDE